MIFGPPNKILSDQGSNFESAIFKNLCQVWRIKKVRTTDYHPATNGACERVNRTIKHGLQKSLNGKNLEEWDTVLSHVIFSYNTSVHSSTLFTPFFLMFGVEARIPAEIILGRPPFENSPSSYALSQSKTLELAYENARENLHAAQKRMKDRYDLGANEKVFRFGDKVRIRLKNLSFKPASKLRSPWSDLFEVVKVTGPVISIRNLINKEIMNVNSDRLTNVSPQLRTEPQINNLPISQPVASNSQIIDNLSNPPVSPNISVNDDDFNDFSNFDSDNETENVLHKRASGKRQIKSSQKPDFIYAFPLFYSNKLTMSEKSGFSSSTSRAPGQLTVPGSTTSRTSTPPMLVPIESTSSGEPSSKQFVQGTLSKEAVWEIARELAPMQDVRNIEGMGFLFVHKITGSVYQFDEDPEMMGWARLGDSFRYEFIYGQEPEGKLFAPCLTDTDLPKTMRGLPTDVGFPRRFLIKHAKGFGPAAVLGTMNPFPGYYQFTRIPKIVLENYQFGREMEIIQQWDNLMKGDLIWK